MHEHKKHDAGAIDGLYIGDHKQTRRSRDRCSNETLREQGCTLLARLGWMPNILVPCGLLDTAL